MIVFIDLGPQLLIAYRGDGAWQEITWLVASGPQIIVRDGYLRT